MKALGGEEEEEEDEEVAEKKEDNDDEECASSTEMNVDPKEPGAPMSPESVSSGRRGREAAQPKGKKTEPTEKLEGEGVEIREICPLGLNFFLVFGFVTPLRGCRSKMYRMHTVWTLISSSVLSLSV